MNKYFLGILLLLFLGLSSCGEDFFSATKEIDLGSVQIKPAVSGYLTDYDASAFEELETFGLNEKGGIFLSRTKLITDTTDFEVIDDATVFVKAPDGTEITYDYVDFGIYFQNEFIQLIPDADYELNIQIPGEPLITAKSRINGEPKIGDIEYEAEEIKLERDLVLDRIAIEIDDPDGANYYWLQVYYEYKKVTDGTINYEIDQSYIYNYNSVTEEDAELFSDEDFDGTNASLEFFTERYIGRNQDNVELNRMIFHLWSISESDFRFSQTFERNRQAEGNPFAEPTIVYSNIEGGLGFFSVSKLNRAEIKF